MIAETQIEEASYSSNNVAARSEDRKAWFLVIDGGGTAVRCAIASQDGTVKARASAGPCNAKGVSASVAVARILAVTYRALASLTEFDHYDQFKRNAALISDDNGVNSGSQRQRLPSMPPRMFKKMWFAIAGIQPNEANGEFESQLLQAFSVMPDQHVRITNDGFLLAAPGVAMPGIQHCIAHVAGTGSISLGFNYDEQSREPRFIGKHGGHGYLIADEGSAYFIGRLSIRWILSQYDAIPITNSAADYQSRSSFLKLPYLEELFAYFGVETPEELVDKVYQDHSVDAMSKQASGNFFKAEARRKTWFAESARITLKWAFSKDMIGSRSNEAALAIAKDALEPMVKATFSLLKTHGFALGHTVLALGGGLWQNEGYCRMFEELLADRNIVFSRVVVVDDAAGAGCAVLAQERQESASD